MGTDMQTYIAATGGTPNGIATGIDWRAADYGSPEGKRAIAEAVTGYFKDLRGAPKQSLKTTLPGTFRDLPHSTDLSVRVYGLQDQTNILSLFRYVDRRSSRNPTYQFANVDGGSVVFEQKTPGEPAKIRKVNSATPTSITAVEYHGALGIDDHARRFDEYDVFEQSVQVVPAKWDDKRADLAAAVFTALGAGVNEAWDTDLTTTVNSAGAQIVEDCGDTYGLPDNPTLALLYNHRRWSLVKQMLDSMFLAPNDTNSGRELQWNIVPVPTRKITTTSLYLALPGNDMVEVEWDELYSEMGRNYLRGADDLVWRARMNLAIGNVAQVRRITPA